MERVVVRALRRRAVALAIANAFAITGAATPVLAQTTSTGQAAPSAADLARARALFAQGEGAAAAGRWREAIDRFEKVRAIKETPGVVFHLAAAHESAGHLAIALDLFEDARSLAAAGSVADVLSLAEGRLASLGHRVPRLVVRVPSPGDSRDVALDGAPLAEARWGQPVRVDPGPHRVTATVRGEPFTREVDLPEGALLTVLVGEAGAPIAEPPEPASPPPPASAALPATGLADPPAPDGPPWGPIALGAGGLALVAGGVVTFVVAGGENADAAEACATGTCDPGDRDTVRALDVTSLALWIGGGAALAGATVWWSLGGDDRTSVEARVGPGRASIAGTF